MDPWAGVGMFSFLFNKDGDEKDARAARPKRYNATHEQNLLRTEKARAAKQCQQVEKRLKAEYCMVQDHAASSVLNDGKESCLTYVGRLQNSFLSKNFIHAQYQEDTYKDNRFTFERDRARSVCALIKGVVSSLKTIFSKPNLKPFHCLNCHTIDDTNTRMRGPNPSCDPTTVFTIMNSVQAIHVRFECSPKACIQSFHIPTPLLVIENADADGIHRGCMSSALLTSGGVGQLLQRFGLGKDTCNDCEFKTFVFVGDSLKANGAAFQSERLRLIAQRQMDDSNVAKHMALQVKCATHSASLIRKPIVLLIPHYWTTLVRLSHLFEGLNFRKQIATALTTILHQSFVLVQTHDYPPEMATWKQHSLRLKDSFYCRSVRKRDQLAKILDFFNGNLKLSTIVHYCQFDANGIPCCKDLSDARNKALCLAVPWLSSGYPCPLLYRFKHFDHAAGFVHIGIQLHSLLTRAIAIADSDSAGLLAGIPSDTVDKLLGDTVQDPEDLPNVWLDQEESYQSTNLKRKQLVKSEVASSAFPDSTTLVNMVIQPMDGLLNMLFKRTGHITKLTLVGHLDPKFQDMVQKNKDFFLQFVSGRTGHNIIDSYHELLFKGIPQAAASDLLSAPSCLQTGLTMCIICITDTWRRFVHEFLGFPHLLFGLVGTELDEFCKLWDNFQGEFVRCDSCVDHEFSRVLLSSFPGLLSGKPLPEQQAVYSKVTSLLADVATFAPLSSEAVECKNGKVQSIVSRRGNQAVKAPRSAREASFLTSSIQAHELIKLYVDGEVLPSKRTVAGILRSVRPRNKVSWQFIRKKKTTLQTDRPTNLRLLFCTLLWMPVHCMLM